MIILKIWFYFKEIIAKFTWLGKKFGIVDKEEDEEEMEEKDKEKKGDENDEKNKSDHVEDKNEFGESPAPSYSGFADKDDKETMSRMRSAYLQSVVQRQKRY